MRMTNTIRDAFIRAAMQDVPAEDHSAQAHKIALAELSKMFNEVFPGVDLAKAGASGWLERVGILMPAGISSLYAHAPNYRCLENRPVWKALTELGEKALAQSRTRTALERKLHAVAYGVTTRKALAAALPEFEKYLPADEPAACRSLPTVVDVVAEFTKAGWPKGAKEKVAA